MFMQILGDPSGHMLKLGWFFILIWKAKYNRLIFIYMVKSKFKKQCPPGIRLDTQGEILEPRKWKPKLKKVA